MWASRTTQSPMTTTDLESNYIFICKTMRHFTALKLDALQSLKDKQSQDTAICPEIVRNQAKMMEEMSVLYVGNISEDVTEDILAKVFGRFGKITQIRLMLPKRDDKHICSFIKFSHFQGAYLAK